MRPRRPRGSPGRGFGVFSGWGFGHIAMESRQGCFWAGKAIPAAVFEISVKAGELAKEEAKSLLRRPSAMFDRVGRALETKPSPMAAHGAHPTSPPGLLVH